MVGQEIQYISPTQNQSEYLRLILRGERVNDTDLENNDEKRSYKFRRIQTVSNSSGMDY